MSAPLEVVEVQVSDEDLWVSEDQLRQLLSELGDIAADEMEEFIKTGFETRHCPVTKKLQYKKYDAQVEIKSVTKISD